MALFGNTSSSTTQSTSVSTQQVTDSYNQAYSRTSNLSDVGNVSLSLGSQGSGLPPVALVTLAVVGIAAWFILKRKG